MGRDKKVFACLARTQWENIYILDDNRATLNFIRFEELKNPFNVCCLESYVSGDKELQTAHYRVSTYLA